MMKAEDRASKVEGQLMGMRFRLDKLEKKINFEHLMKTTPLKSYRLPDDSLSMIYEPPENSFPDVAMDHPLVEMTHVN